MQGMTDTRGPLSAMSELVLRLDDYPFCLAWTSGDLSKNEGSSRNDDGFSIDLIELPRVGLRFAYDKRMIGRKEDRSPVLHGA